MVPWFGLEPFGWQDIVRAACSEDIGTGDISLSCVPADRVVNWRLEAQGHGIVCGLGIAEFLLAPEVHAENLSMRLHKNDGDVVKNGDILAEGTHYARHVLMYERTALNFLMPLSGTATLTAKFVERSKGSKVIDTRKTLPGLRSLQKYAVRCGGGHNHRMGLYDAAMLKDNHIAAAGGIAPAVAALRNTLPHTAKIEVECDKIEQVKEAIDAKVEIILLDNMTIEQLKEVINRFKGQAIFEASGGVNLDTVAGIADTGVDVISVGSLTHSPPALAIHLEF